MNLQEYILAHTERGECQCGKCADKGLDRLAPAHSVDVHFFWVSKRGEPTKEAFRHLCETEYPNIARLKAGPSYIEIGGALGDQGLALRFIGLGELVGLWRVITPERLGITGDKAKELAGGGFVMAGGFQ